jgi:hypothetical protein
LTIADLRFEIGEPSGPLCGPSPCQKNKMIRVSDAEMTTEQEAFNTQHSGLGARL